MKIDLETFLDGEVQQQFGEKFNQLIADIQDSKTDDATKVRALTLNLFINPSVDRKDIQLKIEIKTSLAEHTEVYLCDTALVSCAEIGEIRNIKRLYDYEKE